MSAPVPAQRSFDRSIIEGPMRPAVWRLAWPTMCTNLLGGLQGMIDHAMVGHTVGFEANAAIGVANQIFIVVLVFIMSIFTGMSVLVARFGRAVTTLLEPIHVWIAILVGHMTRCTLSVWRFQQGKWREIRVGIAGR